MIDIELEELRRELSEIRSKKSPGRRYPKQLREAAVAYVRARRAQGVGLMHVLGELGLSWGTARGWLRAAAASLGTEESVSAFRPVIVAAARSATPLRSGAMSLISPRGYRAEGLGLECYCR